MYFSWNIEYISGTQVLFLSEPQLSYMYAYVNALKVKYWQTDILALFALIANIVKNR